MLKTPCKLVLIRHAESERNKALNGELFIKDPSLLGSVAKIPDHKIALTERGMTQAKETSLKLKETIGIPDVVFHSGYLRTKQTTEGILSSYNEKNILVKESLSLREREGGYTHVLLESDKDKYFPYLQDYWDVVGGLFARPVGGESLMDVIEQRLKPFLKELYEEYHGKTVVLVTHGRVIQCLRFILDEMTWDQMEIFLSKKENTPLNAGVTIYSHDSKKLRLEIWNKIWWE
jgi:broad specificity phosphatase PhoE